MGFIVSKSLGVGELLQKVKGRKQKALLVGWFLSSQFLTVVKMHQLELFGLLPSALCFFALGRA